MLPILFEVGSVSIYAWGFALSLAILIGTVIAMRLARSVNIDSDVILDLVIVLVVGGVLGARLFYVFVYEPARFLANPLEIFAIWRGGLVYYGALIGGFIAGSWYISKKKLPFWKLADLFSIPLALGYGIVRIGCFSNGCCYGKETESWVGVVFPFLNGIESLEHLTRYPTQLFSSALGFGLFGLLLFLWKRKRFDGQLFLLFLILYSIGRAIIEYYRENLQIFGNVTISQFVSAIVVIAAIVFYRIRSRQGK